MSAACYITPDLMFIRIRGDGLDAAWSQTEAGRRDGESAVAFAQRIARDGAAFVTRTLGRNTHLGSVVVGASRTVCVRVSAPDAAPDVVAAVLSQREREWADDVGVTSVQALVPRRSGHRSRSNTTTGRAKTVLELHDALVRLFLDELDRHGSSPSAVVSIWHALAPVAEGVCAVAIDDGESIVWSWSCDGALLVGGRARTGPPPGEADESPSSIGVNRVTLDWLSWAAQLGVIPGAVTVIARSPDALADSIAAAFRSATVEKRRAEDALAYALDAAGALLPDVSDPRACLVDLTNRPGRAHRWLGVWSAAAILLLALTVGVVGWRQRQSIADARALAASIRSGLRDRVSQIEPALADDPSPERALESVLAQEREQHKPFEPPPAPMPLHEELARLSAALAAVIADKAEANMQMLKLDELAGETSVTVPDFATGEAILERLSSETGAMRWTGTFLGAPPTTQRLRGVWLETGS